MPHIFFCETIKYMNCIRQLFQKPVGSRPFIVIVVVFTLIMIVIIQNKRHSLIPSSILSSVVPANQSVNNWSMGVNIREGIRYINICNDNVIRQKSIYKIFNTVVNIFLPLKKPTNKGYTTQSENDNLFKFEEVLRQELESKHIGTITYIETGNNIRRFIIVGSDEKSMANIIEKTRKIIPEYTATVSANLDPDWKELVSLCKNNQPIISPTNTK